MDAPNLGIFAVLDVYPKRRVTVFGNNATAVMVYPDTIQDTINLTTALNHQQVFGQLRDAFLVVDCVTAVFTRIIWSLDTHSMPY